MSHATKRLPSFPNEVDIRLEKPDCDLNLRMRCCLYPKLGESDTLMTPLPSPGEGHCLLRTNEEQHEVFDRTVGELLQCQRRQAKL